MITRPSINRLGVDTMKVINLALGGLIVVWMGSVTIAQAAWEYGDRGPYSYYTANPQEQALLASVRMYHLVPGQQKIKDQNLMGAIGDFEFILNKFPNHPEALELLVRLTLDNVGKRQDVGDLNRVDRYIQRAIDFDPNSATLYLINGFYLQHFNKFEPAIEQYNKALALDPASRNAHYNLGLALIKLHRYELANEHAQRAYALGHPLPGLRAQLIAVGAWNPNAVAKMPANATPQ